MDIQIERVDVLDRVIFERFLQLHLYDEGMEPGNDGLIDWGEPLERYFANPKFIPMFFKIDGNIIGFALVRLDRKLSGPDGRTSINSNFIEEFHILRPHRRKKLGTQAADLIFQQYPGRWMISTWPGGIGVPFWHYVVTGRPEVDGFEFGPNEHKGFPGQYVWIIEAVNG